jgi:hypothetical protein
MRLREEKERLTRRLERLRNNLDEMEAEEATLESIIIDQLDFKKMMVSVHVVEEFTPTRSDRLTIELKRTYSIQVCQKVTIALIRFLQI